MPYIRHSERHKEYFIIFFLKINLNYLLNIFNRFKNLWLKGLGLGSHYGILAASHQTGRNPLKGSFLNGSGKKPSSLASEMTFHLNVQSVLSLHDLNYRSELETGKPMTDWPQSGSRLTNWGPFTVVSAIDKTWLYSYYLRDDQQMWLGRENTDRL